jgi:hypothetical protein
MSSVGSGAAALPATRSSRERWSSGFAGDRSIARCNDVGVRRRRERMASGDGGGDADGGTVAVVSGKKMTSHIF